MTSRRVLILLAVLAAATASATENLDWATIGRIRDEGFRKSQVMETAAQLTDVHGPRLSGSPQYKEAADWARKQLETWGLANAHLESWEFGRGWSFERCSAHVVAPVTFPLVAIPKAWTAGTSGTVRGKVVRVKVDTEADVEKFRGKLAGLVVWAGDSRELKSPEERGLFQRYSDKELDDIEQYQVPGARGARGPGGGPPFDREAFLRRRRINAALDKLYAAEKPLAVVEPSSRDANVLLLGSGGSRKKGEPQAVTQLIVSAVQWSRVARLIDRKLEVELELDVKTTFYENDTNGYNVVAELPGGDKKARAGDGRRPLRLVAHRHRRHRQRRGLRRDDGGDADPQGARRQAAPDDPHRPLERRGAGPARLARLRQRALRLAPARAGGRTRRAPELPAQRSAGAITLKPDHAKLAAYFNLDNGTGKIRGIYLQENAAVKPVFESWLSAVEDLGANARHAAQHQRHRPPVLRRGRAAGLPVHPGPDRVRGRLLRDAPHRHGRVRPAAARRPDAGRGGDRDVRVPGREPRRAAAAQASAAR